MSRNSVERCLYFCYNASCAGDVVASIQLATSPKRLIQIRTAFLRIENNNTSKQHIFPFDRPVVVPAQMILHVSVSSPTAPRFLTKERERERERERENDRENDRERERENNKT